MAVREVAEGLVERCRQGDFMGAIERYYGDDIVSIEPVSTPEAPAEMRGIDAIRKKNEWFGENHEIHTVDVAGPYVGDGGFAVEYTMDVTNKPTGQRVKMTEVAVYKVSDDDKIVEERFYYNAPGQ
jgi:hypothetical protein